MKRKKTVKKKPSFLPIRLEKDLATTTIIQPEEPFTTVKHLANLGDIIAVMPSVKKFWEITKRRIRFCQMIDVPAAYYQGAVHPTKSDDGTQVTVNKKMFEMMKPLMESQDYIRSFEIYTGQNIELDFDVIRGKTFVNMPNGAIQSWIMYVQEQNRNILPFAIGGN